jgi:hypothetical protein
LVIWNVFNPIILPWCYRVAGALACSARSGVFRLNLRRNKFALAIVDVLPGVRFFRPTLLARFG